MNVFLTKKMNFPALSVITYYGDFHPHQQQGCTNAKHHSFWQLILVHVTELIVVGYSFTFLVLH
jgi:hypothetical protein